MEQTHPMEQAIAKVGLVQIAAACGKTHQAVRKWQRAGRLPRTEWTGESNYAEKISAACNGVPSVEQLKGPWPKWQPGDVIAPCVEDLPIDFPDRRIRPAAHPDADVKQPRRQRGEG
jgi:hypothetical protein